MLIPIIFNGTIVEFATLHNLKTKDIYQWKTALTKRGFLPMTESKAETDFVTVIPVEQADPTPNDMDLKAICKLMFMKAMVLCAVKTT